jgi:hypothetical protein
MNLSPHFTMVSPIKSFGETLGGDKGPSHGLVFDLHASNRFSVPELEDADRTTLLLSASWSCNAKDAEFLEFDCGMCPGNPAGDYT